MRTTTIGSLTTTVLGLGCAPIAESVERLTPDAPERTIHAALDAGIRLFDTARSYCPGGENGYGETQLAGALRSWAGDRDDVVVATKCVSYRGPGGAWLRDGRPEVVRQHAVEACARLGVDHLDLLQSHAVDPAVPWAETVGALATLREEGLVREIGLSNVSVAQLREATAIAPVASVQNGTWAGNVDRPVLAACAELGITFIPYSPFGGPRGARSLVEVVPTLADVGERHGVSAHVVVLAWLLAMGEHVLPIPAATRPETITDSATAADVALTDRDLADLAWLG